MRDANSSSAADSGDGSAGDDAGSHAAFDMLHRTLQRQLYRMKWDRLRPLQCHAIRRILGGDQHIILAAATAAGKTEAAFLPILSDIADAPEGSVRVLYVSPLKALINDQFRRVEDLCEHLEMPVFRWHGDVSATHKAKLVQQPAGVLLITPESLESLFVNRAEYLARIFGGLRYVVIDELHAFLSGERGLHLRSLLGRLRSMGDSDRATFRIVGLSATIGDVRVAQQYVAPNAPERVEVATDDDSKELRLRIHAYVESARSHEETQPPGDEPDDAHQHMARDVVDHCRGSSNLVFVNAKGDLEELADLCQRHARTRRLPEQFLVHHGSLAAEIREHAEDIMKRNRRAATTLCSSTLEMGIDIGGVRMVGQVGAPWSVASLKQRMGRSGRKDGEPRVLRMYIPCTEPRQDANVFDRIHLDLLQATAIVELMLEGWSEPDELPVCDLSTLTQQIISVISQHGGARADHLYALLCARPDGAFVDISQRLFAGLLRSLADNDVIEQMEGGDLILGLTGERLRKDRGFYAVFQTPQEYSVIHGGKSLGTLQVVPVEEDYLLFAGRRWQVESVDHERRHLHVRPARGWKRPRFTGVLGEIHPEIRRNMRQVLSSDSRIVYLSDDARALLDAARGAAQDAGLCDHAFVPLGPQRTALMTWTGSRIQQTLIALFGWHGIEVRDEEIALILKLDPPDARAAVQAVCEAEVSATALAPLIQPRFQRKYDPVLGEDLLNVSIAHGRVDLSGARACLAAALDDSTGADSSYE